MKKIEKRAFLCMIIVIFLLGGTGYFVYKWVDEGADWATFYANQHIYYEGNLNVGKIHDRNGDYLAQNSKKGVIYNDSKDVRLATAHAVGDGMGHIATGAQYAFRSKLVGFNVVEGTYSISSSGRNLYMTIDAPTNVAAYKALGSHNGFVGVYNYKTGQIVCMVSKPTYDPSDPPKVEDAEDGLFLNKFLSATYTPGSTFKVLTTAATIDNVSDWENWSYDCSGIDYIRGEEVSCIRHTAHGHQDIEDALANSCNCAFAQLSLKVGGAKLSEYVNKTGLTKEYNIDGIHNKAGSFNFPEDKNVSLGWAGVGQFEDQVNPCSLMVYLGAIANGGKAASPYLIDALKLENAFNLSTGSTNMTGELLPSSTADKVADMMKNNVKKTYGEGNFPDLDIYAKSGTAETGDGNQNAWFVGFLRDENHPYAFVVCAEKGETGQETSAPIANTVLQKLVEQDNKMPKNK